jgi:hypothetical protein
MAPAPAPAPTPNLFSPILSAYSAHYLRTGVRTPRSRRRQLLASEHCLEPGWPHSSALPSHTRRSSKSVTDVQKYNLTKVVKYDFYIDIVR